ncbi:MFS transporter [Streptomyces sp.]|uniref:MFS transporter n=1 Tax=Streptomyces sp. TaxID=1931 RepID=UPI0025E43140|nr:MFS transporter [Streptomyces sp.]
MSRTTGTPAAAPVAPGTPADAPAPYRWRWIALAALLAAEAMNLLDATIVQVAAPVIHTDLGGAAATIPWFSASYTLAFALGLLTGARLGDIHGRKRVFRTGVIAFAATSLACALAPDATVLIILRALQGAAAAAIIPQTFGLIRAMFTGTELSKALGMIGPVMGLSAVAGPALGGVLTHADLLGASWRAVFLVNLPLWFWITIRTDRADPAERRILHGFDLYAYGLRWPERAHGDAPVSVRAVTGVVWAAQGDCPQAGSARPVRAAQDYLDGVLGD